MNRATLHISGSVQRAGYRTKVVSIAKALDIKGNVQNLPDGRVKVIAEGEEADIERFIQAVDIKNALINVIGIEKEYSPHTGEYESFYKLVSEGETDERLDTAADLLKELIHVTKNGFDRLEKKQDAMIGKQEETMVKIDQSREEVTGEIRAMRSDFRSLFENRLSKIEFELAEIKAKVEVLH